MALELGVDTYITIADADTYCADFGLDVLSDGNEEALLRQATMALDRLYGGIFIGTKSDSLQTLQWPRNVGSTTDTNGNPRDFTDIPEEVAQATIELAVMLDAGFDPYAQPEALKSKESVEIDVIKTTYETSGGGYRTDKLYKLSMILAPVLGSASSIRLVRG